MFFGQNVHMPWVSDGPKSNHPPADEIHCNLASIHQTWLWIGHSCSTRTYSNMYSDADMQTQIVHTQFTRKLLGGYFWAALLFIIVVVIVVINMMITMTMTMPTTTTMPMPTTMPTPSRLLPWIILHCISVKSLTRYWSGLPQKCDVCSKNISLYIFFPLYK